MSRNGYSPLRFTVWGNSGSLHSRATNLPFLVQQDWLRKSSIKEVESVAFQDLVLVYHPVHYNPRAIFIFGAERKAIRIHPAQRSGGHPPSLPPSLSSSGRPSSAFSYPRSFWTNCLPKKTRLPQRCNRSFTCSHFHPPVNVKKQSEELREGRCRVHFSKGRMAVNVTKCRHVFMSINISAGKEVGNISLLTLKRIKRTLTPSLVLHCKMMIVQFSVLHNGHIPYYDIYYLKWYNADKCCI